MIDPDESSAPRAPDEIDELVTDLFGPALDGSPGWLDGVLVAGGAILIVWAELGSRSNVLIVIGAVMTCLGLVLPVRGGWRWLKARRRSKQREALLAKGAVLNVSDPLVRQLARAHDALLGTVEPRALLHDDAVSAAHQALIESAVLLAGRSPSTPFERDYVESRLEAVNELAHALQDHHAALDRRLAEDAELDARLDREARARAGEELDAAGLSSLQELKDLTAVIRKAELDRPS